jgi:protein-tyrosine phosphatase
MRSGFFIRNLQVTISDAASEAEQCTSTNSYVIIQIANKSIFLASKEYQMSRKNMANFYERNNIGANINLLGIEHGTMNDTPYNTLPLFHQYCDNLRAALQIHDKVLVNCNHGRSRSAAVILMYLMKHLKFKTEDGIKVLLKAIQKRGFQDLNGKGPHGSYFDWIRIHGTSIPQKNNKENTKPLFFNSPKKATRCGLDRSFGGKRDVLRRPIPMKGI